MRYFKLLQCVLLVAVLVQSLSLTDASARRLPADGIAMSDAPAPLKVDRMEKGVDAIVPADATIERVATGFTWVEGPVWIRAGYLMFAEITSDSIRKLTPDGVVSIFLQPSGYRGTTPYGGKEPGSNGMTLDRSGRLTVAGHAHRDVWRLESLDPKGQVTSWQHSYAFRPGRWAQTDFDFEVPTKSLLTSEMTVLKLANAEKFERFDYPGL